MSGFFAPDNVIWKVMGRVADVFVLTILWAICSLPVITIGASTAALYNVTLKMAEKKEGYLIQTFWKAFRENLAGSTILWIMLALLGGILGYGVIFSFHSGTQMGKTMIWFFLIIGILFLFFVTVVFPLSARLDTKIGNLCLMTFMVCIKNFSWVLFMVVITGCMLALGVFVFWPVLFFTPGAVAYFHSLILAHMVFPEYQWNLE